MHWLNLYSDLKWITSSPMQMPKLHFINSSSATTEVAISFYCHWVIKLALINNHAPNVFYKEHKDLSLVKHTCPWYAVLELSFQLVKVCLNSILKCNSHKTENIRTFCVPDSNNLYWSCCHNFKSTLWHKARFSSFLSTKSIKHQSLTS